MDPAVAWPEWASAALQWLQAVDTSQWKMVGVILLTFAVGSRVREPTLALYARILGRDHPTLERKGGWCTVDNWISIFFELVIIPAAWALPRLYGAFLSDGWGGNGDFASRFFAWACEDPRPGEFVHPSQIVLYAGLYHMAKDYISSGWLGLPQLPAGCRTFYHIHHGIVSVCISAVLLVRTGTGAMGLCIFTLEAGSAVANIASEARGAAKPIAGVLHAALVPLSNTFFFITLSFFGDLGGPLPVELLLWAGAAVLVVLRTIPAMKGQSTAVVIGVCTATMLVGWWVGQQVRRRVSIGRRREERFAMSGAGLGGDGQMDGRTAPLGASAAALLPVAGLLVLCVGAIVLRMRRRQGRAPGHGPSEPMLQGAELARV